MGDLAAETMARCRLMWPDDLPALAPRLAPRISLAPLTFAVPTARGGRMPGTGRDQGS